MKYLFLALSLLGTVSFANPGVLLGIDREGISHYVLDVETPIEFKEKVERGEFYTRAITPAEVAVIIEAIYNIGQKVWTVIENNKPVLNVTYAYANALPKGITKSEELDGFSDLQYRSVRHYGTNLFGATVYDVTYTAVHRYGGNYEGQGRYLENVTVLPQNVEVLWGYNVDLAVKGVNVVNVGSKAAPVAGLAMEVALKVKTVMKESQIRELYEFRGDSATVKSHLY